MQDFAERLREIRSPWDETMGLVVESATLELTAIVEPMRDVVAEEEEQASYRFGVETMERERIRVLTTSDLGRVAETARRELRV